MCGAAAFRSRSATLRQRIDGLAEAGPRRRGGRHDAIERHARNVGRLPSGSSFRYIPKVRFEWDDRKAASNQAKHGVSFEQAITAFDDPYALVAPDPLHSTPTEERRWLIGESDYGVLVVVYTIRDPGGVHRLISARRASRKERDRHEQSKGIPV